jgi:hypothetical protein
LGRTARSILLHVAHTWPSADELAAAAYARLGALPDRAADPPGGTVYKGLRRGCTRSRRLTHTHHQKRHNSLEIK